MMQALNRLLRVIILILPFGVSLNAKEEHPAYTRYAREIRQTFIKQVKKEFGFDCEMTGGSMPYDIEEISVKFGANRSATLEQARELEVILTEKFVKIINEHEKIRPFLREYPFPANRAIVWIRFYPPKKQLSQHTVDFMYQANGKIYYRADDPQNPYVLKAVYEEPYAEALKIVQGKLDEVSANPSLP